MDMDFIPKIRLPKERGELWNKLKDLIENSLKSKAIAELEAMSEQDKIDCHFLPFTPEIPKTKKNIEKAIDEFINDFNPEKDNSEELLEYLKLTNIKPSKKAKDEVKDYLLSLSTQELYEFNVFGIVVTEEEAKNNISLQIDHKPFFVFWRLYNYVNNELDIYLKEEDILYKTAIDNLKTYKIGNYENPTKEDIDSEIERINNVLMEYHLEYKALKRGLFMIRNNYSDSKVINTVNDILKNGATTN